MDHGMVMTRCPSARDARSPLALPAIGSPSITCQPTDPVDCTARLAEANTVGLSRMLGSHRSRPSPALPSQTRSSQLRCGSQLRDRLSRPVIFPTPRAQPRAQSDAAPRCPASALNCEKAVTQATAERMRADHHVRKSLATSSGRAAGARPLRGYPRAGCLLPSRCSAERWSTTRLNQRRG